MGDGGPYGTGGGDEDRLSPPQASGRSVFFARYYHPDADLGVSAGSCAQHASLDAFRWVFLSAFGDGQACAYFVSRIFSGEPHQIDGRLAEHVVAGHPAHAGIYWPDRVSA